jgi:hypothetical protein
MADTIVNFGTGVGTLKKKAFYLTPVDGNGAEAPFESGTAVLNSVTPGSVSGVIESIEGNTIKVVFEKGDLAGSAASVSEYELTADADQTSGVKVISQKFVLTHVAAEAVGFGVVAGEEEFEVDPNAAV